MSLGRCDRMSREPRWDSGTKHPYEFSVEQVFEQYFADLGNPVIYDFPVGARVELEATEDGNRVTVLEDPVRLP